MTAEFDSMKDKFEQEKEKIVDSVKKSIEENSKKILDDLQNASQENQNNPVVFNKVSFQESTFNKNETLITNLVGRIPVKCRSCKNKLLVKNLTTCPVCGSSKLLLAAVMHHVVQCKPEEQDIRFKKNRLNKENVKEHGFYVSCQKGATLDTPMPGYMSSSLECVTCPKCLQNANVPIDTKSRVILNNEAIDYVKQLSNQSV